MRGLQVYLKCRNTTVSSRVSLTATELYTLKPTFHNCDHLKFKIFLHLIFIGGEV